MVTENHKHRFIENEVYLLTWDTQQMTVYYGTPIDQPIVAIFDGYDTDHPELWDDYGNYSSYPRGSLPFYRFRLDDNCIPSSIIIYEKELDNKLVTITTNDTIRTLYGR